MRRPVVRNGGAVRRPVAGRVPRQNSIRTEIDLSVTLLHPQAILGSGDVAIWQIADSEGASRA